LVFIADDKDQNLHLNDAESIAATAIAANPAAHARKIYLDAFPLVSGAGGARYPSVSEAIVNQVLAGCTHCKLLRTRQSFAFIRRSSD
jgi:hypothetical protein